MRIVGIILVLLSLPVFIWLLQTYPKERKWAFMALGFAAFGITLINSDAALISWPAWTGYTKGMVVSLADTLALAIIVTAKAPFRRLPFLGVFAFYLGAVLLSVLFSSLMMSSSFYAFQVLRMTIMFVAVATFAGNIQALRYLAFGLALGGLVEGVVTANQIIQGAARAVGTMGHQNLLGLVLHFVTLPLLAMLLAGERNKLIMAGVLGAAVSVALGASRGALLFAGIGVTMLLCLSMARGATPQKWKIVGLGVLGAALVAPLALFSLSERFGAEEYYQGVDSERLAFEAAAKSMWADNPFGIGANQYTVVANSQGYNDRAGVIWTYTSRSAKVHNMYLLAAAETGWIGLVAFTSLFLVPIWAGLSIAFRNRRGPRGEIVLGATVALIATALHGFYEWVFFQVHAQYVFAICVAIIAGAIREERRAAGVRRKSDMTVSSKNRN